MRDTESKKSKMSTVVKFYSSSHFVAIFRNCVEFIS